METRGARRSDRVTLAVPVEVSGIDGIGQDFIESTHTVAVGRHGASFLLTRKLTPEQELIVRSLENNREAEVRVLGQMRVEDGGTLYGVAFINPELNLWDIDFPSPSESEKAASRVLLYCAACKGRELVYLNELETEVFQASGMLRRNCPRCLESTLWRQAEGPATPEEIAAADAGKRPAGRAPVARPQPGALSDSDPLIMSIADSVGDEYLTPGAAAAPERPRTQNDRKHLRSKLQIPICVRVIRASREEWGADEEVTETTDVSRGGFCFKSRIKYKKGSTIEVAVPYKPGAANIFVPARVVNVRVVKRWVYRYGVQYIAAHQGWPGG